MEFVDAGEGGRWLPRRNAGIGEFLQDACHVRCAWRRPADRPVRAVLPELEDRDPRLGRAGVGIRGGGGPGLVCRLDKRGDMVRKPPGECAVGAGFVQFREDSLAEVSELVTWR